MAPAFSRGKPERLFNVTDSKFIYSRMEYVNINRTLELFFPSQNNEFKQAFKKNSQRRQGLPLPSVCNFKQIATISHAKNIVVFPRRFRQGRIPATHRNTENIVYNEQERHRSRQGPVPPSLCPDLGPFGARRGTNGNKFRLCSHLSQNSLVLVTAVS